MKSIIINLIALALIGAAFYMAVKGIPNWGWFLFFGVATIGSEHISPTKRAKNNEKQSDR